MTDGLDPLQAHGSSAVPAPSAADAAAARPDTVQPAGGQASVVPGLTGALLGRRVGPYLIVQRLGGGAMATVYRAVCQSAPAAPAAGEASAGLPVAGQPVALKVLLPDADAVMRERFRREAETHSNLSHPNIVRILDVGQAPDSNLTYIAMELVEGPNLSEVMEEKVRLSAVDAARLLEPVARALDYANRQGIIHRDVKPSNVLLRMVDEGTPGAVRLDGFDKPLLPLLSDFGIARALDDPELTSAGRTIGTPTYMSPEQCADSHEIDGRSDLYSLGAVFYRCIVGRPPYSGTTTQILHAHVYEPLTIPDDVLATLPPQAITILRRTLAKDPAQRYANNGELADDLHHLLGAQDGLVGEDATSTMPTLPAVAATLPGALPTATGYTILVPGPVVDLGNATLTAPQPVVGGVSGATLVNASTTGAPQVFIPVDMAASRIPIAEVAQERGERRRWVGAVIGGVLAALVLIFGGGLALNLLPDEVIGVRTAATATPLVIAAAPTPPAGGTQTVAPPATDPSSEAAGGLTTVTASDPGITVANPVQVTTATLPAGGAATLPITGAIGPGTPAGPTALPVPTPFGDIKAYWAEASEAYDDGDWQRTNGFVTLARRIDPRYGGGNGDDMLFYSLLGLAAQEVVAEHKDKALEHLDAALALRPGEKRVQDMRDALAAWAAPGTLNISMARWSLATSMAAYAEDLLQLDLPCVAAEQLQAAVFLAPRESSGQQFAETQAACDKARREATVRRQLEPLSGRLIYSTQEGDPYRIYRAAAALDASSTLLIDGGSQPARQRRSTLLAFHSTEDAQPGIWTFDLSEGLGPSMRSGQLTSGATDARDAPPSWSAGDRSVSLGSSSYGDRRPRIYRVDANGGTPIDLGMGFDPAWHPTQDRLVFNGADEQGGQQGLWIMNGDGSGRIRLTDNGNDRRPVWTPDGLSIVFMSSRDGNWEVYRLNLEDATLIRLTDDAAQDGLPAVSPDSKWVAFASDRGGFWRIWVVPIDGGEPQPLLTINGVLTNWLEHAIQWIP